MAAFTLPVIVADPDGQNYNFSCGTAGTTPFATITASGANEIIMPDGSRGTQLQTVRAGSSAHLYAVNQFPGLWFVKSLTGSWEIS